MEIPFQAADSPIHRGTTNGRKLVGTETPPLADEVRGVQKAEESTAAYRARSAQLATRFWLKLRCMSHGPR